MSILSVAIASAMLLASHALPDPDSPTQNLLDDSESVDRMIEELRTALHFTERTATAVAFTVADRDNNGVPERIRYAWSGTPGDPLTREYNGAAAVTFVPGVKEFALAYDLAETMESYPGALMESSEQVLSSYDSAENRDFRVKEKDWVGQYFAPTFPVEALSWKVTRVRFQARQHGGTGGVTNVQLRPASASKLPTTTVLEQYQMAESSLPTDFGWQEFTFSNVSGLTPGQALCLTLVMHTKDSDLCDIRYDDKAGAGLIETNDRELAWQYNGLKAMHHYIYGKYLYQGSTATVTRYYVEGVHVTLRRGDQPASRVVTTAETLNRPEVLSAIWESDFTGDPTLDYNGDGQADWVRRSGGVFDSGSLASGVWSVGTVSLDTNPNNNLDRFITAEVRFRSTVLASEATFNINTDWQGSSCGVIRATIKLEANGTQSVTVVNDTSSSSRTTLASMTGLSTDFATVRLLIDPVQDTVNVRINDQQMGSSMYYTYAPAQTNKFATLSSSGLGAQFDFVSVRVAE